MRTQVAILLLHNKRNSGLHKYADLYNESYRNSKIIFLSDIYPKTSQWTLLVFFFYFKKTIARRLNTLNKNYDIIHICDNPVYMIHVIKLLSIYKIKSIVTVHDPFAHTERNLLKKIKNFVILKSLTKSFKTIESNSHLELHLHKDFDLPFQSKILPHPIYRTLVNVNIKNSNKDLLVLGFYGRIEFYKGIDILFKILEKLDKEVTNKSIKIIIAGEGKMPVRPILKRVNVEIHNNFLDDYQFDKLISDTDVMILPYRQASQSGILMKAITYNVPVIASNLEEFTPYIINNETGVIIDINDIDLWVKKIIDILNDKNVLNYYKQNINKIREKYNPKIISNSLYRI